VLMTCMKVFEIDYRILHCVFTVPSSGHTVACMIWQ